MFIRLGGKYFYLLSYHTMLAPNNTVTFFSTSVGSWDLIHGMMHSTTVPWSCPQFFEHQVSLDDFIGKGARKGSQSCHILPAYTVVFFTTVAENSREDQGKRMKSSCVHG